MKAKEGDKVVVDITEWPKKDKNPEGRVIEVLGQPGDPGIEVLSIIREYDFNVAFPQEVQEQVEKIPQTIDRSQHPKRRDLTQKTIVTIDGADAKDLDDGISIEKLDNGNYRLGVHIADVSHYVKENSPLDQEAYDRATSVYLVDRVIPMLPKELSNGICSLNAGVDRLAFTCEMEINTAGKVVNHEFFKSVINVDKRMTYEVVADVLEGTPVEDKEYLDYKEMLLDMERLAELLHDERRHQRGSIDFDFPEAKIILDENGRTKDVVLYERTMAHRIIEEFMLVCNETIAEHMYWTNLPFLFRNHESPSEEKIKALREFLSNFGYKLRKGKDIKPKDVQKLVEDIADTDEEGFLSRLILRSMQQAKYEPNNEGHFGLAAEYYTHFTSPIRRYPDLYIHRVMGEMLDKKLNDKLIEKREDKIDEVAEHVSEKERAAEKAERDTDDL
ncbi:MAG TPA: ribonuclease R, partial [Eubacteriaceae bacterium]|nr:ribonuclease R [Eubacteriaceae bacterium]